jgi:hypothetical protein
VTILDAACWAVCLVLVASGATKVVDPAPFATALAALGRYRSPSPAVSITVGAIEIVLGLSALALGGPWPAAAVSVAYALFAAVVLVARRRGLASCGCFGARSGAPSVTHAVVNLGSALVAGAAATTDPPAVAVGLEGLGIVAALGVVLAVLVAASAIVVADTR